MRCRISVVEQSKGSLKPEDAGDDVRRCFATVHPGAVGVTTCFVRSFGDEADAGEMAVGAGDLKISGKDAMKEILRKAVIGKIIGAKRCLS